MNSTKPIRNEDGVQEESSVADLEVSGDQVQEVQAGTLTPYSPTFRGGVFVASGDVN